MKVSCREVPTFYLYSTAICLPKKDDDLENRIQNGRYNWGIIILNFIKVNSFTTKNVWLPQKILVRVTL